MSEKMTKVQMYNAIKEKYEMTTDEIAFINREIELLNKKNQKSATGEKKPTKAQINNLAMSEAVYAEMTDNTPYRVSEMVEKFNTCITNNLTPQHMTSILKILVDNKSITQMMVKNKSYYYKGTLPEAEI